VALSPDTYMINVAILIIVRLRFLEGLDRFLSVGNFARTESAEADGVKKWKPELKAMGFTLTYCDQV